MYDEQYVYLGVMSGRFYKANGEKTDDMIHLENVLEKQKGVEKINAQFNTRFPTCNRYFTSFRFKVGVKFLNMDC